jgi:pimeloyl-ACP methyl ester carboxylesterase
MTLTSCGAYQFNDTCIVGRKFWWANVVDQTVEVENARVHYWIGGEGEPLVMLQGFGGNARTVWAEQVVDLSKRFTLYAPDLVYFGESKSKMENYSIEFQVDTIVQFLNRMNIKKCHLMGVSYGGLIAYMISAMYPDRVDRLIIVDSPGGVYSTKDYTEMCKRFNKESVQDIIVPRCADDIILIMQIAYYSPPPMPGFVRNDIYKNMFMDQVEEKISMLKDIVANMTSLTEMKQPVKQQTLILWGKYDNLFPVDLAERLKVKIGSNSRLEVIDKTAHAPNMERPGIFNKFVLDFLTVK